MLIKPFMYTDMLIMRYITTCSEQRWAFYIRAIAFSYKAVVCPLAGFLRLALLGTFRSNSCNMKTKCQS